MAIGGFLTPYCPTPHRTRDRSSPRYYRDVSRDHQIFVSPDQLFCRVNTAPGDPGIERDGSPVEARQETGGWGPTDGHRDRLRPGRLPVHHRPESSGPVATGRCPVGPLLVNQLTKSAPEPARSQG